MATLEEMEAQRRELRDQVDKLHKQTYLLQDEIEAISLKISWATYTCSCVRLNRDLGIWNMSLQEAHGRKALGFGSVENTLSADRNCPICLGKGIPLKDQKEES